MLSHPSPYLDVNQGLERCLRCQQRALPYTTFSEISTPPRNVSNIYVGCAGRIIYCKKCGRITKHHLRPEQKAYSCQYCGTLVTPTNGTIFHKSKIALPNWFWVIFQFAKTKTGIPAKQIQRELGVSYPTALRMCNAVRSCLKEETKPLTGQVEADETYMGNSSRYLRGKRPRGRGTLKSPVVGVVERGGKVVARVVGDTKRTTVIPFVEQNVARYDDDGEPTEIFTDEYPVYNVLDEHGYLHDTVCHSAREYVKYRKEIADNGRYETTEVHTNTLEGFWSYPKGATKVVHRGVSEKYLPGYLAEYEYRYNHRNDEEPMFFTMMRQIVPSERLVA